MATIKSHVSMLALATVFIPLTACMRVEKTTQSIRVPAMASAVDVRIVTNAALDEIVGQSSPGQRGYEIDLSKGVVLYHESSSLQSPTFQRNIEQSLAGVGFPAQVLSVRANPPPPFPTPHGWVHVWTDRHTAVIHVPGMKTTRDANIVQDAIAHARTGDDPRVQADARRRRVRVTYDTTQLARMNIEHAIAAAGYSANATPALLGRPDAIAMNWTPVSLR